MRYEKAWAESITKDFEGVTNEQFEDIDSSFNEILESPNTKTKRIKNWEGNVRRIRVKDYRLIVYVSENNLTVYGLAFLPRGECYSKNTKKIILKIIESINEL